MARDACIHGLERGGVTAAVKLVAPLLVVWLAAVTHALDSFNVDLALHSAHVDGIFWVIARPLAENLPDGWEDDDGVATGAAFFESHAAACTRLGLQATSREANFRNNVWDFALFERVVEALGFDLAEPAQRGCCTPSAWCSLSFSNDTISSVDCSMTNMGGTPYYENAGWSLRSDELPLFTCEPTNGTSPSGSSNDTFLFPEPDRPIVRHMSPSSALDRGDVVTLDGDGFGDNANNLTVQVGADECTDPEICHTICKTCTSSAECSENQACLPLRGVGSSAGTCLPLCGVDNSCPCGNWCYSVGSFTPRAPLRLCLEPNIRHLSEACTRPSRFRPSAGDGSERIQCTSSATTPSLGDTPAQLGTVLVSRSGVANVPFLGRLFGDGAEEAQDEPQTAFPCEDPAWPRNDSVPCSAAPNPPVASRSRPTCAVKEDCPAGTDVCWTVECVAGRCARASSDQCSTQSPDFMDQTFPAGWGYRLAPASAAAVMPVPSPAIGEDTRDRRSRTSDVDDHPRDPIQLPWPFPYFAGTKREGFVGANGFIQFADSPPCGGSFATSTCAIDTDYRSLMGPLISDWDPSERSDAVIWTRGVVSADDEDDEDDDGSTSSGHAAAFCARWLAMPQWGASPSSSGLNWTMSLCGFPGGGVRFLFDHVPPTSSLRQAYLSGMRDGPNSSEERHVTQLFRARRFGVGGLEDSSGNPLRLVASSAVELSGPAIHSFTQAALCATDTRACLSPRCGPPGTVVRVRWNGFDCGLGAGWPSAPSVVNPPSNSSFFPNGTARAARRLQAIRDNWFLPRVECRFGAVAVPAQWFNDTNGRFLECVVPPAPPQSAANLTASSGSVGSRESRTVAVSLVVHLPRTEQGYAEEAAARDNEENSSIWPSGWEVPENRGGVGSDAHVWNDSGNFVTVDWRVPGVVFVRNVTGEDLSGPVRTRRLVGQRNEDHPVVPLSNAVARSGSIRASHNSPPRNLTPRRLQQRERVVTASHTLQFTYSDDSASCGCDWDPSSECDGCGVCGGNNLVRDCSGRCYGSAVVDDCGVCSEGHTGHVFNSDKNCRGVCFGSSADCEPNPSPTTSPGDGSNVMEVLALTFLILVVACGTGTIVICALVARGHIGRRGGIEVAGLRMNTRRGLTDTQISELPVVEFHQIDADADSRRNVECPISMEQFAEGEEVIRLPCQHQFTPHLLLNYLQNARVCPMCRFDVLEWCEGDQEGNDEEANDDLGEDRQDRGSQGSELERSDSSVELSLTNADHSPALQGGEGRGRRAGAPRLAGSAFGSIEMTRASRRAWRRRHRGGEDAGIRASPPAQEDSDQAAQRENAQGEPAANSTSNGT